MDSKCGQCNQPFSLACSTKFKCPYHMSECFSCKPCLKEVPPLTVKQAKCSICPRISPENDLYYEYMCGKYFCCQHFLKRDFLGEQIRLPCGCITETEHVFSFMTNFCVHCGRKMIDKSICQLSICQVCANKENYIDHLGTKQILLKADCDLLKQDKDVPNNLVNFNDPQPPDPSEKSQNMGIVLLLQQELEELNQKYLVSDYCRREIKKRLLHESRDYECSICCLNFNLNDRKPMMICLQQHLICLHCFKDKQTLMICPLCREPIRKESVIVCREKIINLELEELVCKKYKDVRKIYMEDKEKQELKEIPQKKEMVSVQTQTEALAVEPPPSKTKGRQKKVSKSCSLPIIKE